MEEVSEQFRILGLHNEVLYEEYGLLGCKTVYFGESPTFRRIITIFRIDV
jgi:hypothetical protein